LVAQKARQLLRSFLNVSFEIFFWSLLASIQAFPNIGQAIR
jgi:hypothetical protein